MQPRQTLPILPTFLLLGAKEARSSPCFTFENDGPVNILTAYGDSDSPRERTPLGSASSPSVGETAEITFTPDCGQFNKAAL